MALIAHYPLNGDTKDYSGYGNDGSIKGTVANILASDAGKIGKCYETTKVNGGGYIQSDRAINLGTTQSMFAWVNIEVLSSSSALNGLVDQHRINGSSAANPSSGMGITAAYLSASTYKVSCSTSNKNGGRTYNTYRGETVLDTSKWYHLGYTYESTSGLLKFYVNGLLDGTHTLNFDMNVVADTIRIFGWNGTASYQGKQKLNDVRIYDHALSDKEVKELAKAKVLHYKFDEHETITTNIFDFDVSNRCWNGGRGSVCSLRTITSKNSMKFVGRSNLHSSSGYAYTYPLFPTTNDVHTFSMVVTNKGDKPVRFDAKLRNDSNGTDLGGGVKASIGSGETARVVTTSISLVSSNLITAAISSYSDTDGDINIEVSEIQLEVGSAATGFVVGTRSSPTVKDSSGFGNDGTVAFATAPTWSEDSPVGRGSMEFDGSLITTGKIFYNNEQAHTVSAWVKPTNIGVGTQNLLNFHTGYTLSRGANGGSLMYMNSGANDHYVYGSKLAENKWTHVTWVYDKSSLRCQVYYDGILHASSTNFDVNDVPSGFKATTILGENFIGNISDVRIYATALTPEDILELYQTRASVDNEGNIFVQEIDEITDTSKEVDSRGIARFKEFNEVGRPVRYIRDWLNGSTSNTNNHWVEIQAIDPSGTNVAKGKSSPSELITDGSTASNPYYSAGSGLKSVTVDLGAAHNITYLHIWHYWSGGRTYHNTKTEVSTDGTNWVTVFDSAIEGEYAESSEGKMIPLYPDKVSIGSDGNIYTNEIMEA